MNWISVKNRMPTVDGEYLVSVEMADERGMTLKAWFDPSIFGWSLIPQRYIAAITHWMPMPNPPESDKSENKCVDLLNSAFAKDPNAIHALMVNRYPCNRELAMDPHVVVDVIPVIHGEHFQAGALGLINGILSANGMPLVAVLWSDEKDGDGRYKMVGFCEYKPELKSPEEMTNEELMT